MGDFFSIALQANTGTSDASGVAWTGILFNGSSGANEVRWVNSAGGATGATGSASWPYIARPTSGTSVVNQAWLFTADTTGSQINTYDGTTAHYKQFRWDWDNTGNMVAAPQFTAFDNSSHDTPIANHQSDGGNTPVIDGSSDTSGTSYLKANAYGQGGAQTPTANCGQTLAVTSGTAGALTPGSAAWITPNWQSLQGWVQYILNGAIPTTLTAGDWFFVMAQYVGVGLTTGIFTYVLTLQYAYS